ncbi:MAG: DedA family protein [Calditrichota bacterium]
MSLAPFIQTYGYPLILIGTFFEGEMVLLAAGFFVKRGYLEWWPVWLIAAAGAMIGDQTFFRLGRKYGERIISKLPRRVRAPLRQARRLIHRNLIYVLSVMRFLIGMRILLPTMLGTTKVSAWRYTIFNTITALLWSGVFLSLGYLFGAAAEQIVRRVEKIEMTILIIVVAVAVVYQLLVRRLVMRKREDI